MPTDAQAQTFAWMSRTRPKAEPAKLALLIDFGGGQGFQHAVIFPDGSYSTATLGEIHPQPTGRQGN